MAQAIGPILSTVGNFAKSPEGANMLGNLAGGLLGGGGQSSGTSMQDTFQKLNDMQNQQRQQMMDAQMKMNQSKMDHQKKMFEEANKAQEERGKATKEKINKESKADAATTD